MIFFKYLDQRDYRTDIDDENEENQENKFEEFKRIFPFQVDQNQTLRKFLKETLLNHFSDQFDKQSQELLKQFDEKFVNKI